MKNLPPTLTEALAAHRRGDTAGAERVCEQLLIGGPRDPQILLALAEMRLAAGRPAEAIAPLRTLTEVLPNDAAHQRRLGGALLAAASPRAAVPVLRRALELEPEDLRALNNLGRALLACDACADAIEHFERAIALNPRYAIAHNNLGLALDRLGRLEAGISALRQALRIDPRMLSAHLNLANALERAGRARESLAAYEAALQIEATSFEALVGRGTVSTELGDFETARNSLESAVRERPRDAPTLARLAGVLLLMEQVPEAARVADRALEIQPDLVEALHYKAAAASRSGDLSAALALCARALEVRSDFVDAWCTRARVHEQLVQGSEAVDCYRRALAIDPDCLPARTGLLAALIPAMPRTPDEASIARLAFDAELTALETWLLAREATPSTALGHPHALALASQPFFYLSYDETSNREALSRYRRLCTQTLAPPGNSARPRRPGDSRLRLGFVSAQVHDHSVFNAITRGWLAGLPRDQFEITVFSLGAKRDASTQAAASLVEHFVAGPRGTAAWLQTIGERDLDAIIFPEIGMDRTTLAIAAHRLAPRQYAAWGHPETSGLATIDAYLSAALFEPPDGDAHYREPLVCLPGIGVHYEMPAAAARPIDLAAHGIREGAIKFVCPGTPFKYRPQFDAVFVELARRIDDSVFVFFMHDKAAFSDALRARLTAAFASAGLDAARHLVWLPWLHRAEFAGLLRQCDVYLDTLGFSGFNTLTQALAAGIPIVTYEGRFLRGRFGSGLLRGIGMPEGIAGSVPAYVDIATRWAVDVSMRRAFSAEAPGRAETVYRDPAALAALARLLRDPTLTQAPGRT
jgi:predicted O-linked N-acetylglucosamine transferase (SPINDLY family)